MASIVAGLNSPPIHRLRRSWAELGTKATALFNNLEHLVQTGKNIVEYRNMLAKVALPCLPFIGESLMVCFHDHGCLIPSS